MVRMEPDGTERREMKAEILKTAAQRLAALAGGASILLACSGTEVKPNIVNILVDDMGYSRRTARGRR